VRQKLAGSANTKLEATCDNKSNKTVTQVKTKYWHFSVNFIQQNLVQVNRFEPINRTSTNKQ
jgi:hypothetical protein